LVLLYKIKGGVKKSVKKSVKPKISKRSVSTTFLMIVLFGIVLFGMVVPDISQVLKEFYGTVELEKIPRSKDNVVRVAVIDTGISLVSDGLRRDVKGGIDLDDSIFSPILSYDSNDWEDKIGHGTYVASIISEARDFLCLKKVDFELEIFSLKIDGLGYNLLTSEIVVSGIDWCIKNDIDIISISFGCALGRPMIREAIKDAYESGILLIVAAGNDGNGGVKYPAKYEEVIAVGASLNSSIAEYSSRGKEVDLVAPGCINFKISNTSTSISGTSFAQPIVSGLAAIILGLNPRLTNIQVRGILQESATDIGPKGVDIESGYGEINATKAVEMVLAMSNASSTLKDLITGELNMSNLIPVLSIERRVTDRKMRLFNLAGFLSALLAGLLTLVLGTLIWTIAKVIRYVIKNKRNRRPPSFLF